MKKRDLAILLSYLKSVPSPSAALEQYQTESEIAAELLWWAFSYHDIQNKIVADFGCGNGILGIGALLLGAKKVYFIDVDKKSLRVAKLNVKKTATTLKQKFSCSFIQDTIFKFSKNVDTIVQNPPFGVQKPHADRSFLLQAFKHAQSVYSIHKIESATFLAKFAAANNFRAFLLKHVAFPLQRTMSFHQKKRYYTQAGIWGFKKLEIANTEEKRKC